MFTPQVIIQIILMFFVLVTIHEFGHLYFAKRAGILVREFAIGFGPKIFSFKKGETRYTLRILPIGGYVRMAGEDPEIIQINEGQTIAVSIENDRVTHLYLDQLDTRSDVVTGVVEKIDLEKDLFVELEAEGELVRYSVHPQAFMVTKGKETQIAPLDRQFGSKTVGQRALAIFAGPLMNFILAFVLFVILIYMSGIPLEDTKYLSIRNVSPNSAAEKAGLAKGDHILNIDGESIDGDSVKLNQLVTKSLDKHMKWIVVRDSKQVGLDVVPQMMGDKVLVGIELDLKYDTRPAKFGEVMSGSWNYMVNYTKQIFIGFKMLATLNLKLDDLGGPVRMVEQTGIIASYGFTSFLNWCGLLSLYLGLFNLLPFPALDGSRLVFLGIEGVRGKPIDPNRESMVHFIGFAMLMMLMIIVTYNDILRLFKG